MSRGGEQPIKIPSKTKHQAKLISTRDNPNSHYKPRLTLQRKSPYMVIVARSISTTNAHKLITGGKLKTNQAIKEKHILKLSYCSARETTTT